MKRCKKKELLDLVNILESVNETIVSELKPSVLCNLDTMMKCQEIALKVGNCLEELDGKWEESIHTLEDYCEDIYQMSLVLNEGDKCRKIADTIQIRITQLKNMIGNNLPDDKKEVVFLPYKASMWDSLESVWQAASEDENCKTYVIPIPYFNKSPDGTFNQMCYEGDEYPDYVPITSWETYIISERRPDVIYIHNPYDQFNYITSVHPDFYASQLRNYTDMLVYIPYFIAIDNKVAEHFCITPGVLYANKVIVQSEKVRQFYINELRKFESENNCKDILGNVEDKVVALGSPKYDKVIAVKREDFQLPEEWERLITKRDGTRKKVVLYNTTIDAMLKQTDLMLKKIKWVLKMFEESRDMVLLWRPHPLLKSTLLSMRPEVFREYIEIEENYKTAGWGIYDDSAELYRAITLSDAYYGDWSSVVELYAQSGKPLHIQNVHNQGNVKRNKFYFLTTMSICGNNIYGICFNNTIIKINMIDNSMQFRGEVPVEYNKRFASMVRSGNKFLLIPYDHETSVMYDPIKNSFNLINLDIKEAFKSKKGGYFPDACFYKNYIYFIPYNYKAIVQYNTHTKKNRAYRNREKWNVY